MKSNKFKDFVQAVNEIDSGNPNMTPRKKGLFSKFRKSKNIEIPSSNIPSVIDEESTIIERSSYSPGHKLYTPISTSSPKSDPNKFIYKKALKLQPKNLMEDKTYSRNHHSENSSITDESTDEEILSNPRIMKKSGSIIGFFNSLNEQEISKEINNSRKEREIPNMRRFQSLDENSFFQNQFRDNDDPFEYSSSLAERKKQPAKYNKIITHLHKHIDNISTMKNVILNDNRFVMVSLCYYMASTETLQNKLTKNLIIFFEANHKSINLLRWAVQNEVNSTSKPSDIFREDSIASKLMSEYAKLVGSFYLQSLLSPFVKKIEKLGKLNEEKRLKIASEILRSVAKHPEAAPFQLRVLCYYIQGQVERKFEGISVQALSGFLFLRFICPAICSPQRYGVINKDIPIESIKELVEVAKLIQNLVNCIFNNKTDSGNSFYNDNYQIIFDFLSSFGIRLLEKQQEFPEILIENTDTNTSLFNLVRYIKERLDKIHVVLQNKSFWEKDL